jgi:hypothetical protein
MYKTMYFVWGAYIENLWNGFAPQEHPNGFREGFVKKTPCTIGQGNQHPPMYHPMDAHYYSVVDEPHLS